MHVIFIGMLSFLHTDQETIKAFCYTHNYFCLEDVLYCTRPFSSFTLCRTTVNLQGCVSGIFQVSTESCLGYHLVCRLFQFKVLTKCYSNITVYVQLASHWCKTRDWRSPIPADMLVFACLISNYICNPLC